MVNNETEEPYQPLSYGTVILDNHRRTMYDVHNTIPQQTPQTTHRTPTKNVHHSNIQTMESIRARRPVRTNVQTTNYDANTSRAIRCTRIQTTGTTDVLGEQHNQPTCVTQYTPHGRVPE